MPPDVPLDRRHLLKGALGLAAAAALPRCAAPIPSGPGRADRLVLVRFGGGVRATDIFTGDRKSSLAPGLWTMAQEGSLALQVRNEGANRHDTGTRYLLTGRVGVDPTAQDHIVELRAFPTLFEIWREALARPREAVFVGGLPERSDADGYGRKAEALTFLSEHAPLPGGRSISGDVSLGACPHVSVSNQLFGRAVGGLDESTFPASGPARRVRLRDRVVEVVPASMRESELGQLAIDALTDRLANARPYVQAEEADDWLLELSLRAIRSIKPELIGIGLSTTDLAHRGSWATYAAQVRRTDLVLGRLVRYLEQEPFYRGRTLVLVTTDCGRGVPRFDRHAAGGDGDDPARQTFLVAYGAGAAQGQILESPHRQVDVTATAAHVLGVEMPDSDGRPLERLLA